MRFRIAGEVGKGTKKHTEFIEKDFPNKKAAEAYQERYCKAWENVKIKKI